MLYLYRNQERGGKYEQEKNKTENLGRDFHGHQKTTPTAYPAYPWQAQQETEA